MKTRFEVLLTLRCVTFETMDASPVLLSHWLLLHICYSGRPKRGADKTLQGFWEMLSHVSRCSTRPLSNVVSVSTYLLSDRGKEADWRISHFPNESNESAASDDCNGEWDKFLYGLKGDFHTELNMVATMYFSACYWEFLLLTNTKCCVNVKKERKPQTVSIKSSGKN